MLVFLLSVWLQAQRIKISWQVYFQTKKPDTLNGIMIGNFYNALLPGNLGELIRARHFSKKNQTTYLKALASQVVEKYIDAFNFVIYVALLLSCGINSWSLVFAGIIVLAISLLYVVIIFNRKVEHFLLSKALRFLIAGRWILKLHITVKTFLRLLSAKQLFNYLLLGYFMFLLNVLQYFLVMQVVNLPDELNSMLFAFLVAVSMIIVLIIPSAPGNVGVVHLGVYSTLLWAATRLGLDINDSLKQSLAAYTIYLHLSYFIPEIVVGFFVLLKERKWII